MSKALEDVRRIEKLAKHLLVKKLTIVLNKPRTALLARFEKRANVAMIYGPLRASLDEWLKLSPLGFSLEQLRAFNISRVFPANQKLATNQEDWRVRVTYVGGIAGRYFVCWQRMNRNCSENNSSKYRP